MAKTTKYKAITKRKAYPKPQTLSEKECFKKAVSKGFDKYQDAKYPKKKKLAIILGDANTKCLKKKK